MKQFLRSSAHNLHSHALLDFAQKKTSQVSSKHHHLSGLDLNKQPSFNNEDLGDIEFLPSKALEQSKGQRQ